VRSIELVKVPRRIVVADDDVLVREGTVSLLREVGYEVIEQVADAEALLDAVERARPDLVIADIRMPPTHTSEGIDAARKIRREFPETGVLLLSAHVELDTALEFLGEGERIGYLLKSRIMKIEDLIDALERIADGGTVIDSALVQEVLAQRRRTDPLAPLTPRERDVLALVAEGRSNMGIAHELSVSEGAVEKHVRSIMGKLDLPATEDDHRRVLAVLAFLETR
jgi:DNA-binding NarL/FixJ family response regulator